jgi:hypothetical protein
MGGSRSVVWTTPLKVGNDLLSNIILQGDRIERYTEDRVTFRADARDSDPTLAGRFDVDVAAL